MFLREMPQLLDQAPASLTNDVVEARIAEGVRGCVCCGRPAAVSFVVDMARPVGSLVSDPRWLDTCAPCAFRIKSLER
jgi:hypothetical protein